MSLTLEAAKHTDIAQIFLMDLTHVYERSTTQRDRWLGEGSNNLLGAARRTGVTQWQTSRVETGVRRRA